MEALENSIIPKIANLGYFLVRTHLFDKADGIDYYLQPLSKVEDKFKNFKNDIFMDDEKLGLIDFGCVKRFYDDFINFFATAMKRFSEKNIQTIIGLSK